MYLTSYKTLKLHLLGLPYIDKARSSSSSYYYTKQSIKKIWPNTKIHTHRFRAQELCESRGGRPGLPVPNSPYGHYGRKATLNLNIYSELINWPDRFTPASHCHPTFLPPPHSYPPLPFPQTPNIIPPTTAYPRLDSADRGMGTNSNTGLRHPSFNHCPI